MDFHELKQRFEELKGKLDAGLIDEEEFEKELRSLYVVDAEGRYWMIGVQTGLWYYYDGREWIQAEPATGEAVMASTEAPSPVPPSTPSSVEPSKAETVAPKQRGMSRIAIPAVAGLIALCCILGAASVVVSEFVLPSRPIGTLVARLLRRTPAVSTPVITPAPMATPSLSASEYIAAGDELFSNGRYEEAVAQYQLAISTEPQNAEAYARVGEAYLRLGNCDQAIPEFQQALALDPDLETAQAGLMECGGTLPPEVAFSSYSRADLNFSLLYPGNWYVREEQLQTIFAEQEENIVPLRGNIFFISSLPLEPEEEGLDNMGALIKARDLIQLPMGSQLGGVEIVSLAGWEWATVKGEIVGLETPKTIYIAATVKDSTWYAIWAIGPTQTWEQTSWPIFRTMVSTVQLGQVVGAASPTAEPSPVAETPTGTTEASPEATATAGTPTATSPAGASPTATTPPPTATPRPSTLSGKIAYPVYLGSQNYEVRIATVGGSVLHTISGVSEPNLRLDGGRIAVRSWQSTERALLAMNLDGGARERIANNLEDSLPRWAGDNASIVYASKKVPHRISQLYIYKRNQDERHLGEGDNPDWSPDGQHIVARTTGIVVMDSMGGNREQLTSNPTDSSPDWSPTGNKIAFMRLTGMNWDIWVINSDGSGEKQLTTAGSVEGLPAWSPDASSIAFLSNRGGAWSIWVMEANGSNQRKLFDTGCATYTTGDFDGEYVGRENWQPRNWDDEQISWSR